MRPSSSVSASARVEGSACGDVLPSKRTISSAGSPARRTTGSSRSAPSSAQAYGATLQQMVSSRADRRLAGVVLVLAATTLALAGSARTGLSGGRVIKGTNGGDLLSGGPRADIVEGLDGSDRLYGRG